MDKPTEVGKSQAAVVVIQVSCGCAAELRNVTEAAEHVTRTGHVVTVHGLVGPRERVGGGR